VNKSTEDVDPLDSPDLGEARRRRLTIGRRPIEVDASMRALL
jgi:hypothetical protein